MSNRPAKRGLCGRLLVQVDKLVILCAIREGIDPRLIDLEPFSRRQLHTNLIFHLFGFYQFHCHARISCTYELSNVTSRDAY